MSHSLSISIGAFVLGLLTASGPSSSVAGAESDFLRFVKSRPGEGRLETANVTYRREDGVEVTLVAAVHVADRAYYKKLQALFATYDALLYEMIKPKGVEPKPRPDSGGLLGAFQRGLRDVLDLEFQLDAINYRKDNFVHADLDPETFFRLQRERGESFVSLMLKAMLASYKAQAEGKGSNLSLFQLIAAFASDDSARALKYLLAQELENVELLMAGFEKGNEGKGSVIVGERNKQAIKVLRKEMARGRKTIGIFYGAAHMPDFEQRLLSELGFKKTGQSWVAAWDVRRKSDADEATDQPVTPKRRRL